MRPERGYWIVLVAFVLLGIASTIVIRSLSDALEEKAVALALAVRQNRTLQDERTTIWAERDRCYEQLRPCLRRCR